MEYSNTKISKMYASPGLYNLSALLTSIYLNSYITYMNISNILAYLNITSTTISTAISTYESSYRTEASTSETSLITSNTDINNSQTSQNIQLTDTTTIIPIYQISTSSNSINKSDFIEFSQLNNNDLIEILSSNGSDLNGCLLNCSNNGNCYKLNNFYECICNEYFSGKSCDVDVRSCSSNPCLNDGICVNILNTTKSSWEYKCNCTKGIYEGENCENEINFCLNEDCNQNGNCISENGKAKCKCFMYYDGDRCENKSTELTIQKGIVKTAVITAIIAIVAFYSIIVIDDFLRYYVCKRKFIKKVKKHKKKKVKRIN